MKISLDWLSEFVSFSTKDPQKIAEVLTLSVAEVEEVEEQGELLKHCCIARVQNLRKHPSADRLSLCEVITDRGAKQVVCGGTNLREGMRVVFAHVGAKVRSGDELVELKEATIRGEKSEGMIAAAGEVGLSDLYPPKKEEGERAIVDLGDGSEGVGKPAREFLGLTDVIFHIDNHAITHRADLFSHVGFARECVAVGLGKWNPTSAPLRGATGGKEKSKVKFGKGKIPFKFVVDAPKLMPRYLSTMISIDGLGETPEWMKRRLQAAGFRSLNLPVDITNYVAVEIGVPLHSFDADDIVGTVHMRTSKKGEKIVTLDRIERELPDGGMILSDDKGIFDLLGIMGGLRSSTKSTTRRIYLHSASLDPVSIRRTVIATGHRTDAATVYEKGVPFVTTEQGFYRAAQLMLELIPGAEIISPLESKGSNGKPPMISLSLARASSILGREISKKEAKTALVALGCTIKDKKDSLSVLPPLHRLGDLHEPIDLVEEVARISGYKSFVEELPSANITPPPRDHRLHRMRDTIKEAGFIETVQYAFLSEELLNKSGQWRSGLREVENPLGEELRYMRPSLLPRLLESLSQNLREGREEVRLFEVGHIFSSEEESQSITLIITSRKGTLMEDPFLKIKSTLRELSDSLGIHITIERKKPSPTEHPGRSAKVIAGGKEIGTIAELHPDTAKNFDLLGRTAFLEIDGDLLLSFPSKPKMYGSTFDFPSITYDSTVVLDAKAEVGSLIEKARNAHMFIRDVQLIDLFEKSGKRHLTFRSTYNAGDRTLTEEEVKPIQEKVEAALRA